MLGVFHKSVAAGPVELSAPGSVDDDRRKSGAQILQSFTSAIPQAASVQLDGLSAMAYSHEKQALLKPRAFAVLDDIFCIFVGVLENLPALRQLYGLTKNVCEETLVIEMYKALRDRAPYPAHQVVKDLSGQFAFVLFDNATKTLLVANDDKGKVPFFWGIAADESLAFSDNADLLRNGCGKSFAPFPAGCFFTTGGGLRSFEHPLNALKPVPRVDSQGQMCGSTFKVDESRKDQPRSLPRVGSDASWGAAC
ncbi:hypothetical protein SELMODRAFT_227818 [Selaginella moellendorffii]|uniref:DUF3700 domain-containing protein n=1 Tax=Selaginella moellendorffii TaxID=88036 RepID=D8RBQ6_SELML|nr:stem-specific protein TSJT1 [Selaginella moellendorffii]EFJ30832.1 hypothetical protein SELMODRAFT_227818 [Selaginella moellendorffii]|eukprot:XP_002968578.1 stem-specific protein TSJT1 [Selaginella moellendorffii]